LEASDTLIGSRNQESEELNSRLTVSNQKIEELEQESEAKLSELKQTSAPAATVLEKLAPDAATILSQLRANRKKSPVSLADIEAILEIMEES